MMRNLLVALGVSLLVGVCSAEEAAVPDDPAKQFAAMLDALAPLEEAIRKQQQLREDNPLIQEARLLEALTAIGKLSARMNADAPVWNVIMSFVRGDTEAGTNISKGAAGVSAAGFETGFHLLEALIRLGAAKKPAARQHALKVADAIARVRGCIRTGGDQLSGALDAAAGTLTAAKHVLGRADLEDLLKDGGQVLLREYLKKFLTAKAAGSVAGLALDAVNLTECVVRTIKIESARQAYDDALFAAMEFGAAIPQWQWTSPVRNGTFRTKDPAFDPDAKSDPLREHLVFRATIHRWVPERRCWELEPLEIVTRALPEEAGMEHTRTLGEMLRTRIDETEWREFAYRLHRPDLRGSRLAFARLRVKRTQADNLSSSRLDASDWLCGIISER